MKKFLLACAAVGMISIANTADAQTPAPEAAPVVASESIVQSTPAYSSTRTVRSARRGGVLSNLIELERRKNAWLRRTFLGR